MYRVIGALIGLGIIVSFSGIEIVDTGYRGVKTRFGEVVSESLPEGIYFYNPITSTIIEMDTRTSKQHLQTVTYTKDVQQATIQYAANYHLNPSTIHNIYKEVGINWDEVIVPQIIEGSIKSIIGTWEAVPLIENRPKVAELILTLITEKLAKRGVTVENFELTNIDYSPDFEKAVEDKVTAIQRASEAKNKTVQVQEEANQQVIAAKAEAESMRIRSEALTQNQNLVQYEAVQKWDGKFPTTMMGNTIPFMQFMNK
jgi:prohibitin 2